MITSKWMDPDAMTQQPHMPEIPGYPYETAPGYAPTQPAASMPEAPQVAFEPATETIPAPAYEVAHNYVVPTVTETYYATADTYTQPAYQAQPVDPYAPPAVQYTEQAPYVQPVHHVEPVQYHEPVQYVEPVQYQVPVDYAVPVTDPYAIPAADVTVPSYAPAATAVSAAPVGLSRTEQRKREQEALKNAKKSNSLFKAWWLYPLVAAIVVCGYLGWQSAQKPVNTAPTTPVVVSDQP